MVEKSNIDVSSGDFFKIEDYKSEIKSDEVRQSWQKYINNPDLARQENIKKKKLLNSQFPLFIEEVKLIKELKKKNYSLDELVNYFQRSRTSIKKILDPNVQISSDYIKKQKISNIIEDSKKADNEYKRRFEFLNAEELICIINNFYNENQYELDQEINNRSKNEQKMIRDQLSADNKDSINQIKTSTKTSQKNQEIEITENKALDALKNVFGFSNFRQGQEEIIRNIIDRKNVLAIMPTGAGKSLCYQIPAIISNYKTIIVSPLIALIDDQVNSLSQFGVNVSKIHSNQSIEENHISLQRFINGTCKIIYVSPEKLMSEKMLQIIKELDIGLIVIDEIHCVSKWGQSFRPDYERLSILNKYFPKTVLAGFTATADKTTKQDILDKIYEGSATIYSKGFDRPNLSLSVLLKKDWKSQLLNILESRKNLSGIIYCLSRSKTEEVSDLLNKKGFNTDAYHAGLDSVIRKNIQNKFMTERGHVIVATIAFGMGIDKPDIRYVIHLNMPNSMESYYQEIGRAGRDGNPADTILMYGLDDLYVRRNMIEKDEASDAFKLKENKRLDYLIAYCETPECRRKTLLEYFDDTSGKCNNCDNCLTPQKLLDGTEFAKKILSAVLETKQYFGQVHIVKVLRGSADAKIIDRGHNRLSVYGVGNDKSEFFWRSFLRQLLAINHLRVNFQKYGAIEITESGQQILKNELKFRYKEIKDSNVIKTKDSYKKKSHLLSVEGEELFDNLKKLRLKFAKELNVPPFVIFHDSVLIQMANNKPVDEYEFLKIDGVGPAKLEKYGNSFLNLINM